MNRTTTQVLSILPLLAYLVFLLVFALGHPLYTWDTVPYTAVSLEGKHDDASSLHSQTYNYLSSNLSPEQFGGLIAGPYARDLYEDPDHFSSQLDMYRIKPAYVAALRTFGALGIEPIQALGLMSLIPGMLICLLLFAWLRHYCSTFDASTLVVIFAVAARITDLSRVPVPDTFSALIVFSALYALLCKRWHALGASLLIVSVFVRTNNILYAALVLLCLTWAAYSLRKNNRCGDYGDWRIFAGSLLASCIAYLVISSAYDYQWWRLFYHTFIESQFDISAFSQAFSFTAYWTVVTDALRQVVAGGAYLVTTLPLFLLVFFIGMRGEWRGLSEYDGLKMLTILTLPVFAAFLVLFPLVLGWDRFFLPFYGLITVFAASRR